MARRPQDDAVEIIENAVAIGTDHRKIARRFDELCLQLDALAAHFGKARRIADGPAGTARAQFLQHLDGRFARHGDEGRVRRFRQGCDRRITFAPAELVVFRVHHPDLAGKSGGVRAPDRIRHGLSADDADMARLQQAPNVVLARGEGGHERGFHIVAV